MQTREDKNGKTEAREKSRKNENFNENEESKLEEKEPQTHLESNPTTSSLVKTQPENIRRAEESAERLGVKDELFSVYKAVLEIIRVVGELKIIEKVPEDNTKNLEYRMREVKTYIQQLISTLPLTESDLRALLKMESLELALSEKDPNWFSILRSGTSRVRCPESSSNDQVSSRVREPEVDAKQDTSRADSAEFPNHDPSRVNYPNVNANQIDDPEMSANQRDRGYQTRTSDDAGNLGDTSLPRKLNDSGDSNWITYGRIRDYLNLSSQIMPIDKYEFYLANYVPLQRESPRNGEHPYRSNTFKNHYVAGSFRYPSPPILEISAYPEDVENGDSCPHVESNDFANCCSQMRDHLRRCSHLPHFFTDAYEVESSSDSLQHRCFEDNLTSEGVQEMADIGELPPPFPFKNGFKSNDVDGGYFRERQFLYPPNPTYRDVQDHQTSGSRLQKFEEFGAGNRKESADDNYGLLIPFEEWNGYNTLTFFPRKKWKARNNETSLCRNENAASFPQKDWMGYRDPYYRRSKQNVRGPAEVPGHPVQVLHKHFGKAVQKFETYMLGHCVRHRMTYQIDGRSFIAYGPTKKEARRRSAAKVLRFYGIAHCAD